MPPPPFRPLFLLLLALCLPAFAIAHTNPARFQSALEAMRTADAENPPPAGAVFLLGSSILAQWTEAPDHLAPLPVSNRAVGGSLTEDMVAGFDTFIGPHTPAVVVYYCGSNDLKRGVPVETAFAHFVAFDQRLRAERPETILVYISSMKSPDRRDWWERVDHYNTLVRDHLATYPNRHYFNFHPAVHDSAGEPLTELFQPDELHLLPPAYERIGEILRPFLSGLLETQMP
ncbi:MAG: hypothetical protein JJT96_20285, partial [Opitutales bacterium]|nr:hypothetical protein [Opitutales bacterium]